MPSGSSAGRIPLRGTPLELCDRRRDVAVVRDPRLEALVLLAPASAWYMHEGALADVEAPVLMFTQF